MSKRNVIVADSAGFCFGVQRAVDMVDEELDKKNFPIYTYGPIIHNETVVKNFEDKGAVVMDENRDPSEYPPGTVIIRSHGVSKATEERLKSSGHKIVDATCPFVAKIHKLVHEHSLNGERIIILGDPDHPEIKGIVGWISGDKYDVINSREEAVKFSCNDDEKIFLVSQTTFNYKKFEELVEILKQKGYYINALNTICNATEVRQEEAARIAGEVDVMLVIGGRNSSNSQKLYEICSNYCSGTYFIQTVEDLNDLNLSVLNSARNVGITAGASTPENIIEEVTSKMSEESFAELLEGSLKTVKNGDEVEGTVISVKPDEIVLNIGTKADGIISRSDYSNDNNLDLTTVVKEGDTLGAVVLKVNDAEGTVTLSHKRLARNRGNKRLEEAFNNHEVLKAKVVDVKRGGLSVDVEGAPVFIPASLVSDTFERDLNKYKDQEIEFVITEFNPRKNRIIGDRKQLLVADREKKQEELLATLKVGDVIEGTVKNVTNFGAFIDLGGIDGLLHISEMSWGRVDNPNKLFKNGDTARVFIKDIHDKKIALSMKFPDENPWNDAAEKYAVGTIVHGKVARMTDFGAFIELAPGVDALLHVSQISKDHVDKPQDVLSVGQEIDAKIVEFRESDHKISLSIKAMDTNNGSSDDAEKEDSAAEE